MIQEIIISLKDINRENYMKKVLTIDKLEKTYIKRNKKIIILENVNYSFYNNKLYTISGKSGAGKTTLINVLGLIDSKIKGTIKIGDTNIKNLKDKELANIRANEIGFVFQSFYLNPLLTAKENIMLPMYINKVSKEDASKKAIELLKLVDLEERENHYPKELSGGEQQRVAIARALANDPQIILADEPTGSLDPENEENIMNLLKEISKHNKCVIVVTHSKAVKEYADIKLEIKNKKIEEINDEK